MSIPETTTPDSFQLQRFVDAQETIFEEVCSELREGQKRSHWMWFIFPQIKGLGHSPTTMMYAISSREEAAAYLKHPILGLRLRECTRLVSAIEGRSVREIFGYPDNLKFHSSMTLFATVANDPQIFREALQKYFDGKCDSLTEDILTR